MIPVYKKIKYCQYCGKEYKEKGTTVLKCNSCGKVFYVNPAPTVNCIIPIKNSEEIVITVRANNPAKGMLELPGGFMEINENAYDTIKREIYEELSIEVVPNKLITTTNTSYDIQEMEMYCMAVYIEVLPVNRKDIEINDGEVSKVLFMNKNEILNNKDKFGFDVDYVALSQYFESM